MFTQMKTVEVLLMFTVIALDITTARRYRYCSEGCCIHEYCAYHKICYPKTHCNFGCPDGTCVDGICMPYQVCNLSTSCPMAHICTYHHNLGYDVCQYNLDIGNTLCVDRYGKSLLKPMN
ncbi:uncharacterized protein [Haliotis cracherodii]|uniref:uncharacterized protein n=1 Tax=Haliotis cracherodii TaxID=6455 RepID=UPI0039EB23E2